MPTRPVNTTDRLSLERVAAIANGEPMTHVVGLTADESDPSKVVLLPDFAELESLSSVPIQYIMWPMHLSDELHYGLYIYDIQQKNGHYIEPMAFDIIEHVFGNPSIEVLREQLYTSRVKQMAEDLGIAKGATKCTFLAQGMHEVFCSDYVIAAIATIAVNELDMQNPDWDKIFVNKFLNEETVRLIRLLEVQLVGEAYFNYQKPKSRRSQDFSTSKAVLLSSVLEAEQPLTRFDNAHLLCMDSLDVADLELALFATQAEEQSFCVDTMLSPIDILPQTEGRTKRFKSSPDLTFWRGSNRDKAGSEENLLHKEHKLTKDLPDNFPKKKPF